MPKKTGFMVFTAEVRESVKEKLRAEDCATSVPEVAKVVGKMWRDLSEDERKAYKERAEADWKDEAAEAEGSDPKDSGKKSKADDGTFPATVVRKIMMGDGEIQRVSAESVYVISKATEMYLQYLVERSMEASQKNGRKLIRLADIENVFKGEQRLMDTQTLDFLETFGVTSKSKKASDAKNGSEVGQTLKRKAQEDPEELGSSKRQPKAAAVEPGQTSIMGFLTPKKK